MMMSYIGTSGLITFSLTFLCFCILLVLIKIIHMLWWAPNQLQRLMGSQGIKGPPFRIIHGCTKEVLALQKETSSKPFGLSHNIFPRLQPHIHLWTNLYGKNYLEWYGPQALLVITESTEFVKEIFSDREKVYPKIDFPAFIKKMLGDGVVVSQGAKWEKMRKLASHAFQAESLKGMVPAMTASVEEMLEKWRNHEGEEIEVFEEFKLMTSEVISRTAFGSSYVEAKVIFNMLGDLNDLASKGLYKQRIPVISEIFRTRDDRESVKLENEIRNSIVEVIKKRESEVIMSGEEDSFGNDFLGILLKAHHHANEERRISVNEMVDECKTFYIAGQDSTSSLLTWSVFLLALHSDWQEKARKEVFELFGKNNNPTPDGILKLKCMSLIINETLRLYPPVIIVVRKVGRSVQLRNLNLPANLGLFVPTLAFHHDPKIWGDDAHLFKPERFSEGVAKATGNNSAAYFPFGMGPRTCLGFSFATIEAKVTLAMILQRYTFTLSPAYVHSPYQGLTLRPEHGLQIVMQSL